MSSQISRRFTQGGERGEGSDQILRKVLGEESVRRFVKKGEKREGKKEEKE